MRAGPLALARDPLAAIVRIRREQGVIARIRVPGARVFLVSDPAAIQEAFTRTQHEYAKGVGRRADPTGPGLEPLTRVLGRGLLTSPPELHRSQRRLIQPMFHAERIAGYAETFADMAEAACAGWTDGEVRDVHRDMTELTLAIVARTVFDVDVGADVITTISRAIGRNQRALRREFLPGGRLLDRLPLPATRRWRADSRDVDRVVYDLIAARRAAPGHTDVLSLLLSTQMPDRQIRDEAMTLLLAGHETTANALAWTFHLLATHPQAQARVVAEAGGPELPYTTAVVRESLRLYPPAWAIFRRLVEDRDVCGHRLPAGSTLLLSPWAVHRDPRWWPEPDRFRPERWLDTDPPHRYAYFPFGGGPRQCIGNAFAELEAVLVTAAVCRRWALAPAPDGPPVVPRPLVTLRPRYGVHLTVRVRR